MTIPCISLDTLAAYFEGSLSDEDKLRMMEHLTACGMCLESFASASSIMKNSKLDGWDPASEEAARRAMEYMGFPVQRSTQKPLGNPIGRLYRRIAEITAEMLQPPEFAPVRSGVRPSENICLRQRIRELETEICLEDMDNDKAAIKIRVSENNKTAENISLTLIRKCMKKIFARNLRNDSVRFDDIPAGVYRLILEQNGLEKGNCFFEIDEQGLHERDNLS